MTRFKELRRIEAAIEHSDLSELEWAMSYCKTRLQTARTKGLQKYWRQIEKKVSGAQLAAQPDSKLASRD
jgi:hypothetical protein